MRTCDRIEVDDDRTVFFGKRHVGERDDPDQPPALPGNIPMHGSAIFGVVLLQTLGHSVGLLPGILYRGRGRETQGVHCPNPTREDCKRMVARPGRLRWFARTCPAASCARISVSASRHSIDESVSFDSALLSRGARTGARSMPGSAGRPTGAEPILANPGMARHRALRNRCPRGTDYAGNRRRVCAARKSFTSFRVDGTIFRSCGGLVRKSGFYGSSAVSPAVRFSSSSPCAR
jgi:hypothetical protein